MHSPSSAGPWPVGRGRSYVNVGFESLDTTRLATPDGVIREIPRFRLNQLGFYGAFGVTERLSLIVDRVGARRTEIDEFGWASGIEDVRAGLQWQLGRRATRPKDGASCLRGAVSGKGKYGSVPAGRGDKGPSMHTVRPATRAAAEAFAMDLPTRHSSATGSILASWSGPRCAAYSPIEASRTRTPSVRHPASATV
jgi:hypothetical protein